MKELSQRDLSIIRNALMAYQSHLFPSTSYVPSLKEWYDDVKNVADKVTDLLIDSNKK